MSAADRKAAIDAYKRRRVVAGVYAVTCTATGTRWVGSASDLSTIRNRIWFSLNLGTSPHAAMQAAWNAEGADSFTFEEIERLKDDLGPWARDRALKEATARWRQQLGAEAI